MPKTKSRKSLVILSQHGARENIRLQQQSEADIVKEYMALPKLPYGAEIDIAKLAVYNWNPLERKPGSILCYSSFTDMDPQDFPLGKNPALDYMPTDYVSPVILIATDGSKYRVKPLLWFPLIDIIDGVGIKQGITQRKVFPHKVFIDSKDQWLCPLFNLVGVDILEGLKTS